VERGGEERKTRRENEEGVGKTKGRKDDSIIRREEKKREGEVTGKRLMGGKGKKGKGGGGVGLPYKRKWTTGKVRL